MIKSTTYSFLSFHQIQIKLKKILSRYIKKVICELKTLIRALKTYRSINLAGVPSRYLGLTKNHIVSNMTKNEKNSIFFQVKNIS